MARGLAPAARLFRLLAFCGITLATGMSPVTAAPAPPASDATPPRAATATEQLANRYSPIVYLRSQQEPCDRQGEAYLPAPVELVLGDPHVALRHNAGGDPADDPVSSMAPTAAD